MARSNTLCLVIAYLCAIGYAFFSMYTLYILIAVSIFFSEIKNENRDPDDSTVIAVASGMVITFAVINFLKSVAMFVASICLIIGINKERHQWIAPWMYLTGISVVLTLLGLLGTSGSDVVSIIIVLVVVAIQVGMWYPIFKLYRELRRREQQPASFALSNGNNTYSPPTDAQGFGGATYAPAGYVPQTQPGVYNPSTQPLYPSVKIDNYPQQTMEPPPYNTAPDALPEKR